MLVIVGWRVPALLVITSGCLGPLPSIVIIGPLVKIVSMWCVHMGC
jgi:hypothetical protein